MNLIDLRRAANTNKGTYGRLLEICGHYGMAGAAILCGQAALRCGVGLLDVVCEPSIYPLLAAQLTEAVFTIGESDEAVLKATALVVGCGMSEEQDDLVRRLYTETPLPAIFDASALNILGRHREWLKMHAGVRVLTPHPKEMSRLCGMSVDDIQTDREAIARTFAKENQVIVVLKGHETIVASPQGDVYHNTSGNAGMASGGTGDVLAGMIGSFLAQGKDAFKSACTAVYLHGLAGDRYVEQYSMTSLLASDLIAELPALFKAFETEQGHESNAD